MRKWSLLALLLLLPAGLLYAQQDDDYQIIVTTPGMNAAVYRYNSSDFPKRVKEDFRIEGNVALNEDMQGDSLRRIYVTIGLRQFDFQLCPRTPIIRLSYDRNRRLFTGVGCNFRDREGKYTPPSFKGTDLAHLPKLWEDEINRHIQDRTLLGDEPAVFILEADIDENGIVHKVVEINGGLKQYAQVLIDIFYDKAVRDWTPATRNGTPFRALAQIRFELTK